MTDHAHAPHIPRPVLIAAGLLMVSTIVIAVVGRNVRLAEAERTLDRPPVAAVDLRFEDRSSGAVAVLDAHDGSEVELIPPASNGFIRGVLRSMFRTRKLEGTERDAPFRLSREQDGRLLLTDPETGRYVELRSFGDTNEESFDRFLAMGEGDPGGPR